MVAVDPRNSQTVYFSVIAEPSRDYKSLDGGNTWSLMSPIAPNGSFGLPPEITSLTIDPKASGTLFASVTIPGFPTHPEVGSSGIVRRSVDGGGSWETVLAVSQASAADVLVDRDDSSRVYAAVGGEVYRSLDSGATWAVVTPAGVGTFRTLAQAPSGPAALYGGTATNGVYRSLDGGTTWTAINEGLGSVYIGQLVTAGSSTVYVTAFPGMFRSDDGGASWRFVSPDPRIELTAHPTDPATLYGSSPGAYGLFPGRGGVEKSVDGGATWRLINSGLEAVGIFPIALDSSSPGTIYAGNGDRILTTVDEGQTWQGHDLVPESDFGIVLDLLVSSGSPHVVYAAGAGLHKSTDGGTTWASSYGNLSESTDQSARSLAEDTAISGRVYFGNGRGKLFGTDDGGETWIATGPPETDDGSYVDTIVKTDPLHPGRIYFGTETRLFRSDDSGTGWVEVPPAGVNLLTLEVDPAVPDRVYAGTQEGLFRSDDAGNSWRKLTSMITNSIAVRPSRPQEVRITYRAEVFRSLDGGATWLSESNGLIIAPLVNGGVGDLTWDASGTRLFAAGLGLYQFEPANVVTLPAVASLHGAPPTFFHSDAAILNTSFDSSAAVTATYRCLGEACDPHTRIVGLPKRQLFAVDDIVATFFHEPETGGAIEFVSSEPIVVTSRLYTPSRPAPTLGMFVPGLRPEQSFPSAVLTSLSHSSQPPSGSRTNIGIDNPSDAVQTARLTCSQPSGALLGTIERSIGPHQPIQINDAELVTLLNLPAELPEFFCLVEGAPDNSLFSYAAVIDNQSQDSIFVVGRGAGGYTPTLASLPAASSLHGAGGTFFHSDVSVFNPSTDVMLGIRVRYRCGLGDCTDVEKGFFIGPRTTRFFGDIVGEYLQSPDSGGAVEFETVEPTYLPEVGPVVTSRLYTPARPAPTVGMFVPGLNPGEATLSAILTSLSGSAGSRTNVGAFNPGEVAQTMDFRLYDPFGAPLGGVSRRVEARGMVQINDVFREAAVSGDIPGVYCVVRGDGIQPFHAYASVIDNQSQDPIFVPGYADQLTEPIP